MRHNVARLRDVVAPHRSLCCREGVAAIRRRRVDAGHRLVVTQGGGHGFVDTREHPPLNELAGFETADDQAAVGGAHRAGHRDACAELAGMIAGLAGPSGRVARLGDHDPAETDTVVPLRTYRYACPAVELERRQNMPGDVLCCALRHRLPPTAPLDAGRATGSAGTCPGCPGSCLPGSSHAAAHCSGSGSAAS